LKWLFWDGLASLSENQITTRDSHILEGPLIETPTGPVDMSRDEPFIVGRLQEHGVTLYQFLTGNDPSYYMEVLANRGERVLWSTDLKRAVAESVTKPQVGDMVGVRRTYRESVTLREQRADAQGHLIESRRLVQRIRWLIEKADFLEERAKLARRVRDEHLDTRHATRGRPELTSTYLSLRSAEQIAEKRIADLRGRERFLGLVREAMATSIERAAPLPAIRLREKAKAPEATESSVAPAYREDDRTRQPR
jgi:hypothetical protein